MARKLPFFIASFVLASCTSRPPVFKQDVDAWKGVWVIELETHPSYAATPREVRKLSDGSEMWTYTRCQSSQDDTRCHSTMLAGNLVTNCSGGGTSSACCIQSFRVSGGMVVYLTLAGTCISTCRSRPESSPCSKAELEEHEGL